MINYGFWHSMPYHFFLIIDGLNEVSDQLKEKLLYELEHKILRRNNLSIKILLTSRDGKSPFNIKINSLETIWKLNPLSFLEIRKLFQKSLPELEAEELLIEFDEKYKYFPEIRTPFFVNKIIQTYQQEKSLSDNIGDILKIYFIDRYKKNEQNISLLIDFDFIINLFQEVSFHIRIKNNQKSIHPNDLKKILKQLQKNDNFLLLEDLKTQDFIDIMTVFEMLITNNKIYEIEHDILADYFASSIVAQDWRNHLELLNNQNYDLLWLFAAQFIPENEKELFLKTIAEKDLILASQCFRNMNIESVPNSLDSIIMKQYQLKRTFYNWQSTYAMSILNTPKYHDILVQELKQNSLTKHHKSILKEALASMGNSDICNELLTNAENIAAIPMITSSGKIDIWERVPLKFRLNFERERISEYCNLSQDIDYIERHRKNCIISIKDLIIMGGTTRDIITAKQILQIPNLFQLRAYSFLLIALNSFKENNQYLRKIFFDTFNTSEQCQIAIEMLKYGLDIFNENDIQSLINSYEDILIIIDSHNQGIPITQLKKNLNDSSIIDHIKDALKLPANKTVIDPIYPSFKSITNLFKILSISDKNQTLIHNKLKENELLRTMTEFWNIATKNNISSIIELSNSLLVKTNNLKVTANALTFLDNISKFPTHKLNSIIEQIKINQSEWKTHEFYRIIKTLLKYSSDQYLVYIINQKTSTSLNTFTTRFSDDNSITYRYLDLSSGLEESSINHQNIMNSFFHYQTEHISGMDEIYDKLLEKLSNTEIDSQILVYQGKRPRYNEKFLKALFQRHPTPKRTSLLMNIIQYDPDFNKYEDAIKKHWNNSIAQEIIRRLSQKMNHYDMDSLESYKNMFSRKQIPFINAPLSKLLNFKCINSRSLLLQNRIRDKQSLIEFISLNRQKINIMRLWIDLAENNRNSEIN